VEIVTPRQGWLVMTDTIMPPVHPGEILLTEFLEPLGVGSYQLAKAVKVPARCINEIVRGQSRISADLAQRLGRLPRHRQVVVVGLQVAVGAGSSHDTGMLYKLKGLAATIREEEH